MVEDLSKVRQMMEWRLPLSVMTRKSLRKVERKRKLCVSYARRWVIMRVNARKNCHKKPQRKDQTCLYLMKTVPWAQGNQKITTMMTGQKETEEAKDEGQVLDKQTDDDE